MSVLVKYTIQGRERSKGPELLQFDVKPEIGVNIELDGFDGRESYTKEYTVIHIYLVNKEGFMVVDLIETSKVQKVKIKGV